jgi:hypothetical protein
VGDGVEHAVEGGAADAEDFCGAKFVAVAGEEDGLDLFADDLVEANEAGFGRSGVGGGLGEGGERSVEVGGGDMGDALVQEVVEGGVEVVEVAGPGLGGCGGEKGGVERGRGDVEGGGEVFEEEVDELGDVVVAFAKGRDFDLEGS